MSPPVSKELTAEQWTSIQYQLEHIHETRGPAIIAIEVIFFVLATVAVGIRFLSRRRGGLPYKSDDWTALFSLILLAAFVGLALVEVHFGYGRHIVALSPDDLRKVLLGMFIFEVGYGTLLFTVKTSFVLLYLRIFGTSSYRWLFILVEVYLVLSTIVFWVLCFVQCRPVSRFWNINEPGMCMDLHALALAMAITNIVGDLLVLLAPFPIVWGLHASRARRLAVVGIFLLGGLVCVVSIVRIPYLGGVFAFDATWEGFPAAVMSVIEPAVGLVCACLPTMMPFFRSCRRAGTRTTRTPNTGSPGQSWGSKPPRLHLTYLSYLAKKGPGGSKSTGMTSSGTQEGSTAWKGESESRLTIP